jgi:DNA-binding NarL/FixJ family response regulator
MWKIPTPLPYKYSTVHIYFDFNCRLIYCSTNIYSMLAFPQPVRLILADDHHCYRDGFKLMLKKNFKNLHLLCEAANGNTLIEQVDKHKPDLVITDIFMPGMNGIEATRIIQKHMSSTNIITLTMSLDQQLMLEAYSAGARGYLLKDANTHDIVEAIKTVISGEIYYSPQTKDIISSQLSSQKMQKAKQKKVQFSDTELSIIELMCREFSTKEIAGKLKLSTRTIDEYRYKLMEKTSSKNMIGIAIYALKNKLVEIKALINDY